VFQKFSHLAKSPLQYWSVKNSKPKIKCKGESNQKLQLSYVIISNVKVNYSGFHSTRIP
jgi:hypothetical protein